MPTTPGPLTDDEKRVIEPFKGGARPASKRFRTSLLAPQVLTSGWSNVLFGGNSPLNVNEFTTPQMPIEWDATANKIVFADPLNQGVINFKLQIDLYFTSTSSVLDILGNLVGGVPDQIWYRFNAPDGSGDLTFPLPDSVGAAKLGGFDTPDTELAGQIQYTVYANQFLRDRGLKVELRHVGNRTVTLQDAVLLAFPI